MIEVIYYSHINKYVVIIEGEYCFPANKTAMKEVVKLLEKEHNTQAIMKVSGE